MDNFITYDYLLTFIGMTFGVSLTVEFFKEMKYIKSIPTKYFTALVALILLVSTALVKGTFEYTNIPLIILNSILITFTATGSYNFNYKKVKITEDISADLIKPVIEPIVEPTITETLIAK